MESHQIIETYSRLIAEIQGGSGGLNPEESNELIKGLSRITEKELIDLGENDSCCPICLTPFLALIAEEETALAVDSPAHPVENVGVTKLSKLWQCGHMFCKRDITKWINDGHDSCPICRRLLVERVEYNNQGEPSNVNADNSTQTLHTNSILQDIQARLFLNRGVPTSLEFGEFVPDFPSRSENRSVEYSAMYT